jgi:hypothetical protein
VTRRSHEQRFGATTFFLTGGLLIWLTTFCFVYVFAAVACARRFADVQIADVGIIPLTTTLASLLAGAATAALITFARKRLRDEQVDAHARFIDFVALAVSAIALVALVWLALPPLMIAGCTP